MEAMEGNGGSRLVVTELSHIKELVKQLDVNLGGCPDLCKLLAAQISTLTERSIGMINSGHFHGPKRSAAAAGLDSPPLSATPSPVSGVSNTPFKTNKKRKVSLKGKHLQIRVSSAAGGGAADAPADDGHSWRKYGQKDILGAHYPRAYYRCTYQKTQGCAATKQVQRADDDPTLFDVIYHGDHTCGHKTAAAAAAEQNPEAQSLLQSLSSGLTVETEGLPAAAGTQSWSASTPFSFSSPAVSGLAPPEHHPFSTPSSPENCFVSLEPSPATSGSNHLPVMNPFQEEWSAESELETVVSSLVAATSTPAPGMEETGFYSTEYDWGFFDFSTLDDVNGFDASSFLCDEMEMFAKQT